MTGASCLLYAVLGDKDRAFAWLEKACQPRTHGYAFSHGRLTWDDIRSAPRFLKLVRPVAIH